MKNKQLLVKLDEKLHEQYKEFCKQKGFNLSQQIRNFIQSELNNETRKNN